GNLSPERFPLPSPSPIPPFPKTFDFIESLFAVFSSADDLGMVRLSKGMPASRVRGNNEERESHHP
ncbi:MAG TPA: hypothetical protein K8U76_16270, partial [Bilophila wadsworthia]|uniref:hypothetical protein n=1 Tax=Bilophila wadsworthia TaxID=35833 RepID=UPI001D8BA77F